MKKLLIAVGTRPEAIKMAPLIKELKKTEWAEVVVLATAQHRELLDQVNDFFEIKPDIDLNVMKKNQDLASLTADLITQASQILLTVKPDAVLVQGDTTTVMSVALASFYLNIPVGHVEAGLRTWDMRNPFPEELNRSIVAKLATWHFAPTEEAKNNLLKDGVGEAKVFLTGNTVIDALHFAVTRTDDSLLIDKIGKKKMVLVTSHRRENFGKPLLEICQAIKKLALDNPKVMFLFPVHPNPNVRGIVYEELEGLSNVILDKPLDYPNFVTCMKRSYLILTDSGGVQEEAPALGKPVLVLRDETERPEAVELGVVKIVGPHRDRIVSEAQVLLDNQTSYTKMAKGVSPYGDGLASKRIVKILHESLCS